MDLDAVSTPTEFVPLLLLAEAHDMRLHPFPPKSFLWTGPPDGWSWGTDSWSLYLRPRLTADGVIWLIEYDDDSARHGWVTVTEALRLIEGATIDQLRPT